VIASEADASKNTLSTGTLTYSDIQNSSSYNPHSGGIRGSMATGDGGANYSTHGTTSGKNAGGVAPMSSRNDIAAAACIVKPRLTTLLRDPM